MIGVSASLPPVHGINKGSWHFDHQFLRTGAQERGFAMRKAPRNQWLPGTMAQDGKGPESNRPGQPRAQGLTDQAAQDV